MRFDIQEKSGNQYPRHDRGQLCLLRIKKLNTGQMTGVQVSDQSLFSQVVLVGLLLVLL